MFKIFQNQLIQSVHTAKPKYFDKISKNIVWPTDQHQVLLVTVKDNTKRRKSTMHNLLSFLTTSMSQILKKRVKFLTLFSLISALSYETTAYYHLN